MRIATIGHSTVAQEALIARLQAAGVALLVDVRRYPHSRRHPQFNREALAEDMPARGIAYWHLEMLGGRRPVQPDSPNAAWREAGFRGYADYLATREFEEGLAALLERAALAPTAIMCAEALPWRCHRRLIADALTVRGVEVVHLSHGGREELHALPPFARVEGTRLTYPDLFGGAA